MLETEGPVGGVALVFDGLGDISYSCTNLDVLRQTILFTALSWRSRKVRWKLQRGTKIEKEVWQDP